jgi:Polyketide cyclase / dehydrase and lipid transport
MPEEQRTDWKYSDCPTTAVSTHIAATIESVWELVSDISLPTRWSSEVQATSWLDDANGPTCGARFAGRNAHAAIGEWEVVCTVTRFESNRCFEWSVGEPEYPSAVWRFVIEGADGSVVLRQEFQMGPAPSGLNIAIDAMPEKESRIIARRLAEHQTNMLANLEGIKAVLEGVAS